jgi:hypothetical protein
MEKTKEILVKLYLTYSENELDRMGIDNLSIDDLRSALYEVLDNQEIFIIDLALYIDEVKRKDYYEDQEKKNYYKKLKTLWDNFSVDDLYNLKDHCSDNTIKNLINKMIILKTAYKKFNQEVVELDLEDYFYNKNKLIELIL